MPTLQPDSALWDPHQQSPVKGKSVKFYKDTLADNMSIGMPFLFNISKKRDPFVMMEYEKKKRQLLGQSLDPNYGDMGVAYTAAVKYAKDNKLSLTQKKELLADVDKVKNYFKSKGDSSTGSIDAQAVLSKWVSKIPEFQKTFDMAKQVRELDENSIKQAEQAFKNSYSPNEITALLKQSYADNPNALKAIDEMVTDGSIQNVVDVEYNKRLGQQGAFQSALKAGKDQATASSSAFGTAPEKYDKYGNENKNVGGGTETVGTVSAGSNVKNPKSNLINNKVYESDRGKTLYGQYGANGEYQYLIYPKDSAGYNMSDAELEASAKQFERERLAGNTSTTPPNDGQTSDDDDGNGTGTTTDPTQPEYREGMTWEELIKKSAGGNRLIQELYETMGPDFQRSVAKYMEAMGTSLEDTMEDFKVAIEQEHYQYQTFTPREREQIQINLQQRGALESGRGLRMVERFEQESQKTHLDKVAEMEKTKQRRVEELVKGGVEYQEAQQKALDEMVFTEYGDRLNVEADILNDEYKKYDQYLTVQQEANLPAVSFEEYLNKPSAEKLLGLEGKPTQETGANRPTKIVDGKLMETQTPAINTTPTSTNVSPTTGQQGIPAYNYQPRTTAGYDYDSALANQQQTTPATADATGDIAKGYMPTYTQEEIDKRNQQLFGGGTGYVSQQNYAGAYTPGQLQYGQPAYRYQYSAPSDMYSNKGYEDIWKAQAQPTPTYNYGEVGRWNPYGGTTGYNYQPTRDLGLPQQYPTKPKPEGTNPLYDPYQQYPAIQPQPTRDLGLPQSYPIRSQTEEEKKYYINTQAY